MSPDPAIRRQALWALGSVGCHLTADAAGHLIEFVDHHRAADVEVSLLAIVRARLSITGSNNQSMVIQAALGKDWDMRLAALQNLLAGVGGPPERLRGIVLELFERTTEPLEWPWDENVDDAVLASDLAAVAWVTFGVRSVAAAEGLLWEDVGCRRECAQSHNHGDIANVPTFLQNKNRDNRLIRAIPAVD